MKELRHKKLKAFSIVEIMIVVTVVGVLMAIAINAYTVHLAKQMVVKAINATAYLRQAIEDYYSLYGYMPGTQDLISGPGGPYISGYDSAYVQPVYTNPEPNIYRIAYYNGGYNNGGNVTNCNSSTLGCATPGNNSWRQIEVTFSNPTSVAAKLLSYQTFLLRANVNAGAVTWECGAYNWAGGPIDVTLLPVTCYNSAVNAY